MPLAMGGSLLLLLGSLSVHSASLQLRLRTAALLERQRAEDALASEAHRLLAALNARHGCLLEVPLAEWGGPAGRACSGESDRVALVGGPGSPRGHRLIDWRPPPAAAGETARGTLLLEVTSPVPPGARRAAFAVVLAGEPRRAVDLRELGLRGTAP